MEIASWNYPYGTDEKPARQRRNSKRLPPKLSELSIWVLGDNGPDKCFVGNLLLGPNTFNATELDSFQRYKEGCIMTQSISVTITPNLFDKKISQAQISQELNNCVQMSAPGPHVLLLVLQEGSAGKKRLKKLATILNSWSHNAQTHTIVLFLSPVCSTGKESKAVEKKLKESWTYHRLQYIKEQCTADRSSVTELFREIQTMTERNKGAYLILNIKESSPTDIPSPQQPHSANEKKENTEMSGTLMGLTKYLPFWNQQSQITAEASTPAQNLNLVLLGRNSAEKSHIASTILGQTESADMSEIVGIYKCVKEEGLVCGRPVTVVNIPEFYNTSLCQMDVLSETYKALSLFSSNIHVFLLVLPVRSLNDDDKGELTMIRSIFGTADVMFWAHLMILFICEEDRKIDAVFDFIQNNGDVQKLYQKCGNKYHIVSINKSHDSDQMAELLQKIDAMTAGNRYVCYSSDMYVEAQLKMRVQQEARNKQLEQEISELMEYKQTAEKDSLKTVGSTNYLRIVLIGKTGNGKSATGNTILNKNVFKSEPSSISVTSSCQKEEGVVNGMPVAVVDTPGLFDTQASNDEVKEEILNCISLLSPGPHVFLLILTIGRFTKEERETLDLIKETFGKNAGMFSIIIFTHGDKLQNRPIECYLENCDPHLKKLVRDCGERCHMIDNTKQDTAKQVIDLLEKVNRMIEKNGGGCYTNEMFQEAEAAIKQEMDRILQQKKEEIEKEKKQLCDIHKREMAEMTRRIEEQKVLMERERKVREEELRVKEEFLKNEIKKREEQEEKERKDREAAKELRRSEEERQQQEWERNLKEIEDKKAELERKLQTKKQEETERYEREKREMEERHKERLKIEKEQEEYREKLNKERSEWEQKQKKMIEEFEQEKKQREAAEKQRIEDEGREKEKLEREFKKSKDDMRKEREEWEKSRKEEWDKRVKEEEKRREEDREKLKKLKDAFEREREEEENKRKREDRIRREQEERERKQMEEEYERKLKDMKMKYEEEARKQAEEFNEFRKKYKTEFHELMLKHDQQMEELKRQYDEKSKMYEKEYSNLTDLSKEKRRELNEKMRQIEEKHQREVDELKRKYEKKCVVL